jgi:hypothetical protein
MDVSSKNSIKVGEPLKKLFKSWIFHWCFTSGFAERFAANGKSRGKRKPTRTRSLYEIQV